MLILAREEGQALVIHDGEDTIVVRVWREGRRIKVGVTAPDHIKILREELEPEGFVPAGLTQQELDQTLRELHASSGVFS